MSIDQPDKSQKLALEVLKNAQEKSELHPTIQKALELIIATQSRPSLETLMTTESQEDSERIPLFDVRGAAAYFAVSENIIHKLKRDGEIPFLKIGGVIRFRVKDLDDYLKANTTYGQPTNKTGKVGRPRVRKKVK